MALGLITLMPKEANAEGGRNVRYGPVSTDTDSSEPRVNSGNPSNGAGTSNNAYTPFYSANLASPSTYTYVSKSSTSTTKNTTAKTSNEDAETEEDSSDLTANALSSGGFMPSGLAQWLLFAIMILFLVILVRKTFGADKAYHATPLKHD